MTWQPIETYDREIGSLVVVLDWYTYRTDSAKKRHPIRYVAHWSDEYEVWFDDDNQELDIDPTHWFPLPEAPDA